MGGQDTIDLLLAQLNVRPVQPRLGRRLENALLGFLFSLPGLTGFFLRDLTKNSSYTFVNFLL
jgi:hypothetical protein